MTQQANKMKLDDVTEFKDDYEVTLEDGTLLMVPQAKFYSWIIKKSDVLYRDRKISLDEWLEEWDELKEVMTEYLEYSRKFENVVWAVS